MLDSVLHEPRELHLPQAFLGWSTLAAVLLSAVAQGADHPLSWTLLSMTIMPLFLGQVLLDLFRGLPRSANLVWPPAVLFLVALAWAVIQSIANLAPELGHPVWELIPNGNSFISANPEAANHYLLRLSLYAMTFWVGVRSAANSERAMDFLKAISIFSTGLAGFGIWWFFTGDNPVLRDAATGMVSATFLSQNSYATYAVFGAIANIAIYTHLSRLASQEIEHDRHTIENIVARIFSFTWIFSAGAAICLAAIVLTLSRSGNVAAIVGIVVFLSAHRRRQGGFKPALILSVFAIMGFIGFSFYDSTTHWLLVDNEEAKRLAIYPLVIGEILNRPFLGHGLGAFAVTFHAVVPVELANVEWSLAHNSYLENAYELGIPAASAFYLALIWVTITIARGTYIRRRHQIFSCFALACIAAAGFHAFFDATMQVPATAALFSFIIGMGWVQSFRRHIRVPR